MMKSPWFFILVGVVLMTVALVTTYYVWQVVQVELGAESVPAAPVAEQTSITKSQGVESTAATPEVPAVPEVLTPTVADEGIPATDLPLSETQKELAGTLGIDIDTLVITSAMQQCATEAVGSERYEAIIAGATPGVLETTRLLGCLNQ